MTPQSAAMGKDLKVLTILKSTERDCPKCDAVFVQNINAASYKCPNYGYIDCGKS